MITPHKPEEWQFASVIQRGIAHVIDTAVALAFILLGSALLSSESLFLNITGILIIAAAWAYRLGGDAFFHGQALGKRLLGIKVVDAEHGRPCTPMQSLIRTGIFLIPVMPLVELVLLAIDGQERWGDRAARTYVLRLHAKQPAELDHQIKPMDFKGLREVLVHQQH